MKRAANTFGPRGHGQQGRAGAASTLPADGKNAESAERRQERFSKPQATTPAARSRSFNLNDSERFKIDRQRIAAVHVAKSRLGMAEEAYRAMLRATAGVNSSKDLTEEGFRAVMQRFEQLGFVPGRAAEVPGDRKRPGMASEAQCAYIRHMWVQWSGRASERDLGRWLERRFHVSDLRFADVVTAQKAIEGLRAMLARGTKRGASAGN